MPEKYENEATGIAIYCCRLSVADQLTSEKYVTTDKVLERSEFNL